MYAVILGILMIVELVGFIMAFVYKGKLESVYRSGLTKVLENGLKNNNSKILDPFFDLQKSLKCCGANNVSDFDAHNETKLSRWCEDNHVTNNGCAQAIITLLDKNLPAIGITLGVVLALEFFGLLFAVMLAVAIGHAPNNVYSSRPVEVLGGMVQGRRHNYH